MPRGDGTGPAGGGGPGTGRGSGRGMAGGGGMGGGGMGGGRGAGMGGGMGGGRGRNNGGAYGPGGDCICVHCNTRVPHQVGVSCTDIKCPTCGKPMVREELYNKALSKLREF